MLPNHRQHRLGLPFFLTGPIFWLLHELNKLIGNMGVAIIGLTLLIKAVLSAGVQPTSPWRG